MCGDEEINEMFQLSYKICIYAFNQYVSNIRILYLLLSMRGRCMVYVYNKVTNVGSISSMVNVLSSIQNILKENHILLLVPFNVSVCVCMSVRNVKKKVCFLSIYIDSLMTHNCSFPFHFIANENKFSLDRACVSFILYFPN